jgi:hypothetical protein
MSKAEIQESTRRLRRLEDLVRDQRARLAAAERNGDPVFIEKHRQLLLIFTETLETAKTMAQSRRQRKGVET